MLRLFLCLLVPQHRRDLVGLEELVAREVIDFFRRKPATATPNSPLDDVGLGPREQQVLEFLVDGLSYKEIAADLGITTNTVATYVRRIYEKLHVRSRREIIAYYRGRWQ